VVWLASQRVTAPGEPFDSEIKTKSKDSNHPFNPTFSKAIRKESVREMHNFIKEETTVFFGAILAALGIHRERSWGWGLGALVSVGAFAGYVISRTIGLPGLPVEEEWLEPLGLLSMVVEALFVGLFLTVFVRPTGDSGVHGKSRRN
jgi:hypothetical protein